MEEPFIFRLVPVLAATMGDQYPELQSVMSRLQKLSLKKKLLFLNSWQRLKMIERTITDLRKQ